MQAKSRKTKETKAKDIQSLIDKISKSKSIVVADYRGLTVNQVNDLRKKVREVGGELVVIKNTLFKRALKQSEFETDNLTLEGPSATLFSYEDQIQPLKALADVKKTLGFLDFKLGFLDKELLNNEQIEALTKLPSKLELQAKVVGTLAGPLYQTLYVLQANLRNLVSVLDQAAKSK
ncbi:MAG TPA: 50S ribosomal protein L10 [Patescibacteria group bacterium]